MTHDIFQLSTHARTILGEFHPNVLSPDDDEPDLRPYLVGLSEAERSTVAAQFDAIADHDRPILGWLEERVGDDLQDDAAARVFLGSLARFIDGTSAEQPDIGDVLA